MSLATSVMIAINKKLVRSDKMYLELPKETLSTFFPDIIQYYPSSITSPHAFTGDPTKANQKKGEEILARCLDRLEKFLTKWMNV